MKQSVPCLLTLLFLILFSPVLSQVKTIVHDGYSGMEHCHILDDSVFIMEVVRKSPAWNAGIKKYDKVVSINGVLVAKKGVQLREVNELLFDVPGTKVDLEVVREGVDSLLHFQLERIDSDAPRIWLNYEYLVDSTESLTIEDILEDSLQQAFIPIQDAKITIVSVQEGSLAARGGLQAGDKIISLFEALDNHDYINIDEARMWKATMDTLVEVIRDSLPVTLELNPRIEDAFEGVTSRFGVDFQDSCVWLKFRMEGRITEDRAYLIRISSYTDSIYMYEPGAISGPGIRKTGWKIDNADKDYLYKGWEAIRFHLDRGEEKVFYLKMMAKKNVEIPYINVVPLDTITRFSRLELLVLAFFTGMLFLIIFYYLILYVSTRYKYYLFYTIFIIGFIILLLYDWSYLNDLGKGRPDELIYILETFIYSLPFCFFLLFGVYYLELKSSLKFWYRFAMVDLVLMVLVNLLALLLILFDDFLSGSALEIVLVIFAVFVILVIPPVILLVATVIRVIRRYSPAYYFLVAIVILGLLILFHLSRSDGLDNIERHISYLNVALRNSAILGGAVLQFLVFSLGLARKMRLNEEEKKVAQLRIIEQLKENEQLKDKVNRELEQKVVERTSEIREQKEEIEAQRDEIEAQRDQLQIQKDVVVTQKEALTDSINYARRIQNAVLPRQDFLEKIMPEHFVLFRPRDIVSGDFYWIREVGSHLVLVVADCTGHGVPGAFMSMLGITLLNELIGKSHIDEPGILLEHLRGKVKETLAQEGKIEEQKDGMDMALVIIDKESLELQYAGAYNPLYRITAEKEGRPQLLEYKGDKQPVAYHQEETAFSTCKFRLEPGDTIYLFSDGFVDQLGGPDRKKFLSKRFKSLLLDIQNLSMTEQHHYLENTLSEWSNGYEQIDDVLVMGLRL